MYAIVYKSDGFPICQQVAGVSPDPVVTWNTEAAAKAFISSKGGDADFQPVQLTDEVMDKIAQAMGCPVESHDVRAVPELKRAARRSAEAEEFARGFSCRACARAAVPGRRRARRN